MEKQDSIFTPAGERYNHPAKIVTLGHCYAQGKASAAAHRVRESRADYNAGVVRDNAAWTRLITALNKERQWPLKQLYAALDPVLAPNIAVAVVPPHRAFQAFWPLRTLAQKLCENDRVDATACLVRHTTIRRIIYGGPSTRALHRQTIQVEHQELVAGRRVLLLDDIAKSGASLVACRRAAGEAGAETVQAMALGRVIVPGKNIPLENAPVNLDEILIDNISRFRGIHCHRVGIP